MSHAETELKLLLPGAQPSTIEERLRRLGALARRRQATHWLWNVYFDTPDQQLRQQRHALRLRCISDIPWRANASAATVRGEWVQTFKSAGVSQGGLSRRGEWERRQPSGRLDPEALRETPWADLDPDGRLFGQLTPCFETRCRRTVWTLHRYQGATIEVALDIGEIAACGRSEPILELEFELLQGPSDALFHLARQVASEVAVLPFDQSKAERGYRLAQDQPREASPAQAVHLAPGTGPQQAVVQALAACFDHFSRNLACTLVSDDPEVVHQARVGWRRWRSAVRLFAPWLPGRPDADGLRPLLAELGRMRDLDVLRVDTLGRWLPAFVDEDAQRQRIADVALERIDEARRAQRRRLRDALAAPGTGQTLLALAQGLFQLATAQTAAGAYDTPWARKRIRKLRRRLDAALKASRRAPADLEKDHRVRIQAKRVRYAAEILRDLLPARRTKGLTRAAIEVQTRLGAERDLRQAVRLLEELRTDAALTSFLRGVLTGLHG
ncbi:CYTH and CHAD domain-containing protein [Hydrogenophaga sp. NH-16]|uniref:CYTH and CHAD domain-containing protein n=1 Tax=Hydrogenophaga sp. NH-16 TaxID=2184519 RepID=UPI000FD76D40|nr:CYTH and CHAD domain-containing protein [Hydrogenophaga sp. NH-16]